MPIFVRTTPIREPLTFDSLGNHWDQENVCRTKGDWLYHYLLSETGSGRIEIQGKKYILDEGEGVLIAPSVSHSYHRISPEWRTCFARFTGTLEGALPQALENRPVIFTEKSRSAKIRRIISLAVEQYQNPPIDTRVVSIYSYQLFMEFIEGLYTHDLLNEPLYAKYLQPVIEEIEKNYSLNLTVEGLSHMVYISPQYLTRLFVRFLGCPASEYLTTFRVNQARAILISNPHLKVQDIARLTGFSSSSHFITAFRKITGRTPLEFRKLVEQGA